jgi:hypothetical protein
MKTALLVVAFIAFCALTLKVPPADRDLNFFAYGFIVMICVVFAATSKEAKS